MSDNDLNPDTPAEADAAPAPKRRTRKPAAPKVEAAAEPQAEAAAPAAAPAEPAAAPARKRTRKVAKEGDAEAKPAGDEPAADAKE